MTGTHFFRKAVWVMANGFTTFQPLTYSLISFLVLRTRREMPRGAVRSRSRSQYRLGWRPPSGPLTSSEGLSLFRAVQPPV